jgi:CheY-like chemotaxis protein
MKKILIVDDQYYNIEAVTVILKYAIKLKNYHEICDYALNGKIAYEQIIQNVEQNSKLFCNYDLILMDCNMPIMDGYEATHKIRQYLFDLGIQ